MVSFYRRKGALIHAANPSAPPRTCTSRSDTSARERISFPSHPVDNSYPHFFLLLMIRSASFLKIYICICTPGYGIGGRTACSRPMYGPCISQPAVVLNPGKIIWYTYMYTHTIGVRPRALTCKLLTCYSNHRLLVHCTSIYWAHTYT